MESDLHRAAADPRTRSEAQGSIGQRPGGNARQLQRTRRWSKALRSSERRGHLETTKSCLRDASPKERPDRDQRREGNGMRRTGQPGHQARAAKETPGSPGHPEHARPDQAGSPGKCTAADEGKTPKGVAPVGKDHVLPTRPTPRKRDDEHPSGSPEARRRGGAAESLPKGKHEAAERQKGPARGPDARERSRRTVRSQDLMQTVSPGQPGGSGSERTKHRAGGA